MRDGVILSVDLSVQSLKKDNMTADCCSDQAWNVILLFLFQQLSVGICKTSHAINAGQFKGLDWLNSLM